MEIELYLMANEFHRFFLGFDAIFIENLHTLELALQGSRAGLVFEYVKDFIFSFLNFADQFDNRPRNHVC